MPTIKPLDEATILREAARSGRMVVVAENHTIIGGLGEAVAGAAAALRGDAGVPADRLAGRVPRRRRAPTLHERYGISTNAMARQIKRGCRTEASPEGDDPVGLRPDARRAA